MREILKKMLRPRVAARMTSKEALDEILQQYTKFSTEAKRNELSKIDEEYNKNR